MKPTIDDERVRFDRRPDTTTACPNCAGRGMEIFYEAQALPAHSCLLMPSAEAAMQYPKRNLRLGYCPRCAFICNTIFDPSVHEYGRGYEETQGYSPTFNRFAQELAQTLVDRHQLAGKTVLEIGCGKGEFLEALCERGVKRGIGIDPSFVPGRLRSAAAARMEVIQDLYDERYAHLEADFICCRHTLEHIGPTRSFMSLLRRSIGDRSNTVVFFELPDAQRVITEGAFWDVYYEHCSYFTPRSLTKVFRDTGFDVTDLERVYDDQYLLITAVPSNGPTDATLTLEDEAVDVDRYVMSARRNMERWRNFFEAAQTTGERVVVWGSGSKGVAFLTTLDVNDAVSAVVDINPHRQGKFMPATGHRIVAPEALRDDRPHHVVVMNPIYQREIGDQLRELGVDANVVCV